MLLCFGKKFFKTYFEPIYTIDFMKWIDFEIWFCKSPIQQFENKVNDDSLTSAFNDLGSSYSARMVFVYVSS
jgi:hypothetical protein